VPFCVNGGPLAADGEAGAALAAHAAALMRRLSVPGVEFRSQKAPDWLDQAEWPARPDLYVSFRKAFPGMTRPISRRSPASSGPWFARGSIAGSSRRPVARHLCGKRAQFRHAGFRAQLFPAAGGGVRRQGGYRHRHGWRGGDRVGDEFLFPRSGAALLRGRPDDRAGTLRQRFYVLGGPAPRRRARVSAVRFRPQQAGHRRLCVQEELGLRAGADGLLLPSGRRGRDPGHQPAEHEIPPVHRCLEAAAAAGGRAAGTPDRAGLG
jgi:hypothetical protein